MRSYSFDTSWSGGRDWPAQLVGAGFDRVSSRDYRWDNDRHRRRGFHVLQYTTSGQGLFRWRDSAGVAGLVTLGPGDLFLASPDLEYEYRYPGSGEWEFLWVLLEGSHVDHAIGGLRASRGKPVVRLAAEAAFVQAIEHLLQRQAARLGTDAWGLSVLAWELVTLLYRLAEGEGSGDRDDLGALARKWVAQCPSLATAAGMADHFGYNPKYFAALFRQRTGTTPGQFILAQKVALARLWLSTTRRPVGTIAADLGFSEDNHFSKTFRRLTGTSPTEYRAQGASGLVVDEVVTL